jgi:hypothetical protein
VHEDQLAAEPAADAERDQTEDREGGGKEADRSTHRSQKLAPNAGLLSSRRVVLVA